jgi:hypothetical protein
VCTSSKLFRRSLTPPVGPSPPFPSPAVRSTGGVPVLRVFFSYVARTTPNLGVGFRPSRANFSATGRGKVGVVAPRGIAGTGGKIWERPKKLARRSSTLAKVAEDPGSVPGDGVFFYAAVSEASRGRRSAVDRRLPAGFDGPFRSPRSALPGKPRSSDLFFLAWPAPRPTPETRPRTGNAWRLPTGKRPLEIGPRAGRPGEGRRDDRYPPRSSDLRESRRASPRRVGRPSGPGRGPRRDPFSPLFAEGRALRISGSVIASRRSGRSLPVGVPDPRPEAPSPRRKNFSRGRNNFFSTKLSRKFVFSETSRIFAIYAGRRPGKVPKSRFGPSDPVTFRHWETSTGFANSNSRNHLGPTPPPSRTFRG